MCSVNEIKAQTIIREYGGEEGVNGLRKGENVEGLTLGESQFPRTYFRITSSMCTAECLLESLVVS